MLNTLVKLGCINKANFTNAQNRVNNNTDKLFEELEKALEEPIKISYDTEIYEDTEMYVSGPSYYYEEKHKFLGSTLTPILRKISLVGGYREIAKLRNMDFSNYTATVKSKFGEIPAGFEIEKQINDTISTIVLRLKLPINYF